MFGKHSLLAAAASLALLNTACNTCQECKFKGMTDVQAEKIDDAKDDPREHFANMADNAILQDMSVADFHFVPHTAELSGTGAARLNRMATLLDTYGGVVRYDTYNTDEALVKKRLEHVREYVALTGCDMGRVTFKAMTSGGRGMAADKAIRLELKGTATTVQGGAAPALTTGASGMTGSGMP